MRPPPFAAKPSTPYRLRAPCPPKRAWFFTVVLSSRAARKAALRTVPPKPSLKVPGRGASTAAVCAVFRANRRQHFTRQRAALCANSGGRSRCSGETGLVGLGQPCEAISRESHKPFKGAAENTKGMYQLKIFSKTRSGDPYKNGRRCGFCRNRRKSTGPALHRGKIRRGLSMELFWKNDVMGGQPSNTAALCRRERRLWCRGTRRDSRRPIRLRCRRGVSWDARRCCRHGLFPD